MIHFINLIKIFLRVLYFEQINNFLSGTSFFFWVESQFLKAPLTDLYYIWCTTIALMTYYILSVLKIIKLQKWVSIVNVIFLYKYLHCLIIIFYYYIENNSVCFTRWKFSLDLKLIEDENRTTDDLKGSMEMFVTQVFGDHKSRLN